MKIAISGAICTGKTTFGRVLAERLGCTFIAENMECLFGRGQPRQWSAGQFVAKLVEVMHEKDILEEKAGNFVVDRCAIDLMNFWMASFRERKLAGNDIFELCGHFVAKYDFVILTPWGVLPLTQESEDVTGPVRTCDPWLQFRGSCMISGLARHFLPPEKIIEIPRSVSSPDERLDYVCAAMDICTS